MEGMDRIPKKPIKITDTTFRDGHQSTLATRMRTEDMVPIAAELDQVGFYSVEMWGGFLPEQQTDFIFSVLGEEWGLIGSLIVASLYLALILWGLRIAVQSKDRFGAILSFGVVAMLFWHVFINIGMVLGMMPVVGIPLPLLSYGGSFIISTCIRVGLLLNVSMRRYLFCCGLPS